MARIEIIVEDAEEDGKEGVIVRIESAEPPLPVKDGTLDFEAATPSQNIAFGAVMEIIGLAGANELVVEEPGG
jgi:hypothetical protein